MTIHQIDAAIVLPCNHCGTAIHFDYLPWFPEDGGLCANCEADLTDNFFEKCWEFVNRIQPPALEE